MRDFSNGLAIVNPASSQTFNISLPGGIYKNLYGKQINTLTLAPHTGIVLLGTPAR